MLKAVSIIRDCFTKMKYALENKNNENCNPSSEVMNKQIACMLEDDSCSMGQVAPSVEPKQSTL
ncbi:hypothetical protein C0J52_19662 [Blattella germanica]|nr:hypothetical protein C0J52_19662 [Blattella germanica]